MPSHSPTAPLPHHYHYNRHTHKGTHKVIAENTHWHMLANMLRMSDCQLETKATRKKNYIADLLWPLAYKY